MVVKGLTVVVVEHHRLKIAARLGAGVDHRPARSVRKPMAAHFQEAAFYFVHVFFIQLGNKAFHFERVERNFLLFHVHKSLI